MEQLSTIFSPKTYWVDVTDKQCDVGDTVTFDNDKGFVFTKKEDTKEQTPSLSERIAVLEDAVNTLMEGGLRMARYLAYQIILQKLKYNTVITRFPKYKEDIDKVLDDMGWMIDDNGDCVGKKTD